MEIIHSDEIVRKLREEKLRRIRDEKYRYYIPNGKIEEYINLLSSLDFFIIFISAANGVGKTAAGANILANMFWPSDNKYFQGKMFKEWPFKKKGRIVTDSALIDKNIVSSLKEWFPKDRYKTKKSNKSYDATWETDTGWDFDIMSYDQQPKEFEGVTLGWAWLDEPPPDIIFKAIVSRMREGGMIFISATPLSGSGHLYDMFVENKTKVTVVEPDGSERVLERKVAHVTANVWDASIEKGIRGHLSMENINNMIAEYDEDERQARVYGKFQHLVGMVFKKWDQEVHVIKPFNINKKDYVVWNMLDAHPRNPDAIMWCAVDKYGTKYVIDEIYLNFDDVEEMAQIIKAKDALYRVEKWIADPSAWPTNQHDEKQIKSLAQRLKDYGVKYEKATKSRTLADLSIKNALNYTEIKGKIINPPELYIFNTCKRTLFEMPRYRWDEHTGKISDRKDRKEKPVDKDDHMIECLGRFLIQEPRWKPFVIERKTWEGQTDNTVRTRLDPYN